MSETADSDVGLWSVEQLQTALACSPFQRWLELRAVAVASASIVIELPRRDDLLSKPRTPAIHGGVLATR